MLRLLALVLFAIFSISVIRMVVGVLMKLLAGFMGAPSPQRQAASETPPMPVGGELRKDPVCGTYVSTATDLKKTAKGETFYFCSPECRDKFA